MNSSLTELVFVLDKSGSMSGLEKDTIGGFNSMLDKQRKEDGDVVISTVLFDDRMQVLHDRESLDRIKNLTERDYQVGGCTALLDALGKSIRHINKIQKSLPEDERPAKTMFIITTDGQENSSHEYSYEKIKKMVEKKQEKKQWEFLFLGANMDAISAAADIGIKADRAANFHCDELGTAVNYSALSKAVSRVRKAAPGCVGAALRDWDGEVKEDFKARK
ncbi:MAG: VWA domain-containing protein [Lachnospiraceae bacterium]|nr:VWA domain-containing protein [Lachnospiraceae bacterium]